MFLLGLEKQRKKHNHPCRGWVWGSVASPRWHAGAAGAENKEANSDLSSAPLPSPSPGHGASGSWPWQDHALWAHQTLAPNPKIPYPSLWGGQRWKLYWFTLGLSSLEARIIFPYITIIKNNYSCYWIFILTTPGPDICIKLNCRTFSGDFSTAAKHCKS